VIVRWGLDQLPQAIAEVGIESPYVIAGERWRDLALPSHTGWWSEVPSESVPVSPGADGLLAVGGGSAIDTAKHASAETGLPLVAVPTTYSGAEWTAFYGIRSPDRRLRGGGGGANTVALVYDVDLTLDLPRGETAGTSMNALAHCAEALYTRGRSPQGDEQALEGARLIATALPRVLASPHDREARLELLQGAAHAGHALGIAGLALAHAMAQALGGRYGLSHGAMNALCLPPALEYNRAYVPAEVERFGVAIGGDPVATPRELARLGGIERLRDFGVPRAELPDVAAAAVQRPGNRANPTPATPREVAAMYESIW
jgi:maleylacetate reductase